MEDFNDRISVSMYFEVTICHDLISTTTLFGSVESIDGFTMVVGCVGGKLEFDVRDPAYSVREVKKVANRK